MMNREGNKMAKGKNAGKILTAICAVNDDTSDDPIVFMFDSPETRAAFMAKVEPRFVDDGWKVIDQMTARDVATLTEAIQKMDIEDLEEALESADVEDWFDEFGYRFYGELHDIYDVELASGERVRGTGRTF
jgi:hypothetical protein